MKRVSLLDVNVLVALANPDHVHHELAHDWFADHERQGWATCPVTENGFVRVLSQPQIGTNVERPEVLVGILERFHTSAHHVFWPDGVSLSDGTLFNRSVVLGHRQLTDVYLLGLARRHGGVLVTFDRSIPLGAVVGASKSTLAVIAAD